MPDEIQPNLNPSEPVQPESPPPPAEPAPTPISPPARGGDEEGVGEIVNSTLTPATSPSVPTAAPVFDPKSLLTRALAAIQFRKAKKLEKIMLLAAQKPFITNDQVEKLLRVSDATATRYLALLVRQGRLKRIGHPRHARYQPV